MAAIAFDSLKCARKLKDAGYTDKQAEVQAEIMAEAFVFNMDSLVSRDFLDARLDARFTQQDAHIDIRFAEIKSRFLLQDWILGAIAASTVLPALYSLLYA